MAKKTAPAKTASAKDTTPKVVAPPAPEVVTKDVAPSNDVVEQGTELGFTDLLKKLNDVTSLLASVKQEARALEKRLTRELKAAQKLGAKKRAGKGNRCPSGFVKPTLISDVLANFLGKDKGTEMARTDVTREINKYIRENGLQDKNNGRKINADSKLSKLLNLGKSDELTYFNLQRFMSPHFAKGGASPLANASS